MISSKLSCILKGIKRVDLKISVRCQQISSEQELKVPKVVVNLQLREKAVQSLHPRADIILKYWFGDDYAQAAQERLPTKQCLKRWFGGGEEVDKEVKELFQDDVLAVEQGQYSQWKDNPLGILAKILLMDQFTRNIYRGSSKMYSLDSSAFQLAQHITRTGMIDALLPIERVFVSLPFEHWETIEAQEFSCALLNSQIDYCRTLDGGEELTEFLQESYKYAELHRDVVAKWSRFPHRNEILQRESTPQEIEGLKSKEIPNFG